MNKVTVIVPCYNCATTVERTLDSLAAQTLKDLTLLVVNDGSTDETQTVLEKWREAHPDTEMDLYIKENEGIAECRNFAVDRVKTEWFGFLDSDDYTDPHMFEDLLTLAEKEDLDLAVSDFYWKNQKGETLQKDGPYEAGPDMVVHLFAVLWNKLYRLSYVRSLNIRFPYGDRYEDACWLYCMSAHRPRIGFTGKAYVRYVQQGTSITHTNNDQVKNMIHVFEIITEYYKNLGVFDEFHDALEYVHIRFFLGNSFLRSARIKDPVDRRTTIFMGWDLLNREFPHWKDNPYLKSEGGMKNRYYRMVKESNIMAFAWFFRHFKKENL